MSQRLRGHKVDKTFSNSLKKNNKMVKSSPHRVHEKATNIPTAIHIQQPEMVEDEPEDKRPMLVEHTTAIQPSPYAAKYILAMVRDLKKLASKSGLTRVALILEMAELEASDHTDRGR